MLAPKVFLGILTEDARKLSRDLLLLPESFAVSFCQGKHFAGKMADLHVLFISALVLSCCLQILAGYARLSHR